MEYASISMEALEYDVIDAMIGFEYSFQDSTVLAIEGGTGVCLVGVKAF